MHTSQCMRDLFVMHQKMSKMSTLPWAIFWPSKNSPETSKQSNTHKYTDKLHMVCLRQNLEHHISPNKCAGHGGTSQTLLVWLQWGCRCELMYTLTLSAKKLIQIGLVVLRYGQVKTKVGGMFLQAGMFIQQNTVYTQCSCQLSE